VARGGASALAELGLGLGCPVPGRATTCRVALDFLTPHRLGTAQVGRLVLKVADKSQIGTQRIGQRPYGVGLLVAGADATGPHLYETKPSGQYFEYFGMAIGARSQAGRTYLEKHFESFADLSLDELITHALLALRETIGTSGELSSSNVTIGYVAEDTPFAVLEDDAVAPYVDAVKKPDEVATSAAAPEAAPEAAAPAMETD